MKRLLLLSTLLAVMITGCGDVRAPRLNGTGSTQVESLLKVWTEKYPSAKISYEAVGSSLGVDRFVGQDFNFACTEVPVSPSQKKLAEKNGITLEAFPLAFSAVVPVYHLDLEKGTKEKASKPLVFSGSVLADIFLGKITLWNDPSLQELNPGVPLPKEPIQVIVRSDFSGTSYVFSDYLAQVSKTWEKERGVSDGPNWTKADNDKQKEALSKFMKVAGTRGMINTIKKTAGSIGFVSLTGAKEAQLQVGSLKINEKIVAASKDSIEAALKIAFEHPPEDLMQVKLINQTGDNAYPIIDANWILFSGKQKGYKGKQLVDFLRWAAHEGQDSLDELSYIRIPKELNKRIDKILDEISVK